MSRIAIYGGSFNPIHSGHLIVAEEIRQLFSLDQVIFVPTAQPPHKPAGSLIDSSHRLNMLQLAIKSNPHFSISDIEIRRGGTSYTIDTLSSFKKRLGKNGQLYFVLGSDAFIELDTWKQPIKLFDLANFIVIERPGALLYKSLQFLQKFSPRPYKIIQDPLLSSVNLSNHKQKEIFFAQATLANISASGIRQLVLQSKSIRYLVPDVVKDYIDAQGLYK